MGHWWTHDIVDAGKLPLMLTFIAFVVTFLITRTITRMIRRGVGPFHNNVTSGGTHIHHAVPGLILLIIGAVEAIATESFGWLCAAGVLVGVGISLVLDEFALILNLRDVYWSTKGRVSVAVWSLTGACLGLLLLGFTPIGVNDIDSTELTVRLTAVAVLLVELWLIYVCLRKDKFAMAAFGLFVGPLSLIGAIRLAHPDSAWARRHYDAAKKARATARFERIDQRWGPLIDNLIDFFAGSPSPPPTKAHPAPAGPAAPPAGPSPAAPSASASPR